MSPDLDRLRAWDGELVRLAKGQNRVRYSMGQALVRFDERGGHRELGFSSLGAFAAERCSRSGRWVADTRAMARRLSGLPLLEGALVRGELNWSMVELVCRHATAETEAVLVELAKCSTVRAMRDVLAESADGSESELKTLTMKVPVEHAWVLQAAEWLVGHMGADGDWLEAVLAEGHTTLLDMTNGAAHAEEPMPRSRRHGESVQAAAEARAEDWIEPWWEADDEFVDEELPDDLLKLDDYIRQCAMRLAGRDLWMGQLLDMFLSVRGYADLSTLR